MTNKKIPIPENEKSRLEALDSFSIMDSLREEEFDAITKLASMICGVPIAVVSLLDDKRQWFKSIVGLDVSETSRDISFCQYAIMENDVYEVTNAIENPIFENNPLVVGDPNIRFYAGAPLDDGAGHHLGTLCVIDSKPHQLSDEQKESLRLLAKQVVALMHLRKRNFELEKSRNEFNNFFNLSIDLVCVANVDGTFKRVNPMFMKVLGYSREELEGHPFTNFIHDDDVEATFKEVQSLGEGKLTISFRNRFRCKNGSFIILNWSAAPDLETGNLYALARNVTELVEVENKLIKSTKLLEESQNLAKIGSWKFYINTQEIIWSKEIYNIFELDDLPPQALYLPYRNRFHPDDIQKLDELLEKAILTGEGYEIEHRIIIGENIKYLYGIAETVKNESGEVVAIKGTVQDITEKKLSEARIAQKRKEITSIKLALDESAIVAITDQAGKITYVNDNFCSISKYSEKELLGQDHRIINSGYHPKEFFMGLWQTIAKGDVWRGEVKNKAKDGSYYWVNTTIVPFINEEGKPFQYIAIRTDVTDRKLAENKLNDTLIDLEKKNIELDQFAYVISHDLKAPLRAINNLAEWIIEDMPQMPPEVKKNLHLLQGRIFRMESLINGVLDYSKIGRSKLNKEEVNFYNLITSIVDSIITDEKVHVHIDKEMPTLKVERILIYQVFSNLISNAVKYNDKENIQINCTVAKMDNGYRFSVIDNGPGIPEAYHEKVFGVFQTIEARDVKESTGIGLAIVKKIINELEGDIWIESEESLGTSFIFTLPNVYGK